MKEENLLSLGELLSKKTYHYPDSPSGVDIYDIDDILDEISYLRIIYAKLLSSDKVNTKQIEKFQTRLQNLYTYLQEKLKDDENN